MTETIARAGHALPAGSRLGGYTLEHLLAADEFGFVYRSGDSPLLGRVAIEEYFPRALARREAAAVRARDAAAGVAFDAGRRAFEEESRRLMGADMGADTGAGTPGLLRVIDAFEANGTVYRVRPWLDDAPTLAQWRRARTAPPDAAWLHALLLGLLETAQALHERGTLHGHVQPDNILLPPGGRPLLGGFGTVGRALGSAPDAAYAPPEQSPLHGHLPRGPWTDVYALAAVTWFAATGRAPVSSVERAAGAPFEPGATLRAALRAEAQTPAGAALCRAVEAAMALPASARPPDAAALRRLLLGEPGAEPARAEAPPRRQRRPTATAWAWAMAALTAVAAGLALAWNGLQRPGEPVIAVATPAVERAVELRAVEPGVEPVAPPSPTASPAGSLDDPLRTAGIAAAAAAAGAKAADPAASAPPESAADRPDGAGAPGAAAPSPPPQAAPVTRTPRSAPSTRTARTARAPTTGTRARSVAAAPSPRAVCGERRNFSLHYCMQTQCAQPRFVRHAQCRAFRREG